MAKRRLGCVWLRLLVRRLLLLLFLGTSTQRWDYHLYTAMAVCWDSANCHCFATSDPRKGRFAACGPKSMCVDAGFFPYLVLTSFWTSFFSFVRTHPAVYKLGNGPASRFCLWASTVPTKKGPLETGVPMEFDQKRIEPWYFGQGLLKLAFPMGKGVLQGLCRDTGRCERFDWE